MKEEQSQFVLGVLANFSGVHAGIPPKLKDRRFVTVTRKSFSQFLAHMRPRLARAVRSDTTPEGILKLDLTFERLEDFLPENISRRLQISNAIEPERAQRIADTLVEDEGFKALHSTWVGLKYLVDSQAKNPNVKIKALDLSKRDLLRDLQRAPKFDQSILFRRAVDEGIGTFGGEAFGCLIGDYYLTSIPDDVEVAQKVSNIAAAAGAPFLCAARPGLHGVTRWKEITAGFSPYSKPGAPASAWWQSNSEWPDGWSTFLLLPDVRPIGVPPETTGPWSPDYALHGRTMTWLNPAVFVGRVVADAFRGDSLAEIVRRLFPPWPQPKDTTPDKSSDANQAATAGLSEPPQDEPESLDLEYEWDIPAEDANHLAKFGLNALSESRVGRQGLVQALVSASPVDPALPRSDLAQVLLCCCIGNRLREYLRSAKRSERGAELVEVARAWLAKVAFQEPSGRRVLPFERISATRDGANIRVHFTLLSATCGAGRTTDFFFQVHL